MPSTTSWSSRPPRPRGRSGLVLDGDEAGDGPTIVEVDLRRRDGGVPVPCELSIVNLLDDPTVNGLVVSAHNITQLRSTRDALERLATRDPLTGLPNRKLILDRIEQMQKRGRRTGETGRSSSSTSTGSRT